MKSKKSFDFIVLAAVAAFAFGCSTGSKKDKKTRSEQELLKSTQVEENWKSKSLSAANETAQQSIRRLQKSQPDMSLLWLEFYCFNNLNQKSQDPKVRAFLDSLTADESLNEAQDDGVQECISAMDQWKSATKSKGNLEAAKKTMALLRDVVRTKRGSIKNDSRLNEAIQQTIGHLRNTSGNVNPETGEAYLLLAEMSEDLDDPKISPAETLYLKRVISLFHHSDVASAAYDQLHETAHFGYTGSSGDQTPSSIVQMLGRYRDLSLAKKTRASK